MDQKKESNASYFERYLASKNLTDDQIEEFNMRLMEQFCADFWRSGNPADVPAWIMNEIATQFMATLMEKTALNNYFPLPWDPADPVFSRAEKIDRDLYREIFTALVQDGNAKVTSVIEDVAKKNNVSYEKASKAYYKYKL
jgi:hypothetical protein